MGQGRPSSQRERDAVDRAVRRDRSNDYHRAANLVAEASRLVHGHAPQRGQVIYELAKGLRDDAEQALTID